MNANLENAQRQFVDIGNGDYAMTNLLDRGSALAAATLALFSAFKATTKTRSVTFQSQHGVVELQRPARPHEGVRTARIDRVTVSVREGRVVRFTEE
jgi:hypothetical protein